MFSDFSKFLDMINVASQKPYFFLVMDGFAFLGQPFFVYGIFLLLFLYVAILFFFVFLLVVRFFWSVLSPIYSLISFLVLFLLSFILDYWDFGSIYWNRRKFSFKVESFAYGWSSFFFPHKSFISALWSFFFGILHRQNIFFYFKFAFHYFIRMFFKFCLYRFSFFLWWFRRELSFLDLYSHFFSLVLSLCWLILCLIIWFFRVNFSFAMTFSEWSIRARHLFVSWLVVSFVWSIYLWLYFSRISVENISLKKGFYFRVFFCFRWCFIVIFFWPISFLVKVVKFLLNRRFLIIPVFFFRFFINFLFILINFLFFFRGYFFDFINYFSVVSWKRYLMHNFLVVALCGFFVKCVDFLFFFFKAHFYT